MHAVREATGDDADDVARLLDAAMLESDRERVRRRIEAGTVLVAVVERYGDADGADTDDRVVGACVLGSADSVCETGEGDEVGERDEVGEGDEVGERDEVDEEDEVGERDEVDECGTARDGDIDVDVGLVTEIEHIAVHRSRRGRGIGTALVDAADERSEGALAARFREQVRSFYESLGFEIVEHGADESSDDRLYAVLR